MIGKLFKFLAKTISLAIFLALIIPAGYFAVRMGQPMDLPEYKGLTYYQYLEWEKFEQHENWEKNGDAFRAKNPDSGLSEKACNGTTFVFGHGGLFFSIPLAITMDSVIADKPFDAIHFLSDWWAMFEKEHLVILSAGPNRFPACRIPGAISDDYALSVGAQLPDMVQE